MTVLLAAYDLLRDGLPAPAGLAIVALLGYIVGRIGKKPPTESDAHARREILRAQSVARNLETIARAIRKDLARHRASLDRFKDRVNAIGEKQSDADWKALCEEAEQILAPTMHLATQIAHSYDQIRQQTNHLMSFTEVRTDPLTGVCNRRAMDDTLNSMVAMKNRYGLNFSLGLFDIDHFKKINDSQGHLAGDQVLKAVARLIEQTARDTDVVTRYGGEEFVVIMPQTDLRGAATFGERLRSTVERQLGVTISGGVTGAMGSGEAPNAILERADSALYAAKQAGRNRVFRHDGVEITSNGPALDDVEHAALDADAAAKSDLDTAPTA